VRAAHGQAPPLALPDWLQAALGKGDRDGADCGHRGDGDEGDDGKRTNTAIDARLHAFDPAIQAAPGCPAFTGVRVYPDALTPAEVADLLAEIEAVPFVPSQSGKQKQHFGPRFNFTRRRMNADRFEGIPDYAHRLEARLRERVGTDRAGESRALAACRAALDDYATTDVFVLRYLESEQSNLDFHVDDLFAYGEAILDVSLDSDSVLTFLGPIANGISSDPIRCVRVPLPARSIAVVYGPARSDWHHAILPGDIHSLRTSVTLRTLAPALRLTDAGRRVIGHAGRRRPSGGPSENNILETATR